MTTAPYDPLSLALADVARAADCRIGFVRDHWLVCGAAHLRDAERDDLADRAEAAAMEFNMIGTDELLAELWRMVIERRSSAAAAGEW